MTIRQCWNKIDFFKVDLILKSEQLQLLMKEGKIKPVINQVESHAYFNNDQLNDFCKEIGVKLMGKFKKKNNW